MVESKVSLLLRWDRVARSKEGISLGMEEAYKWLEAISSFVGLILLPLLVGLGKWMIDLRSVQSEHTHILKELAEWRKAHEEEVRLRMDVVNELKVEFHAMIARMEWHGKQLEQHSIEIRDLLREIARGAKGRIT